MGEPTAKRMLRSEQKSRGYSWSPATLIAPLRHCGTLSPKLACSMTGACPSGSPTTSCFEEPWRSQ